MPLRTHIRDGSTWETNPTLHDAAYFSVYYHILDDPNDTADLLLDLFDELPLVGCSTDVATGSGSI